MRRANLAQIKKTRSPGLYEALEVIAGDHRNIDGARISDARIDYKVRIRILVGHEAADRVGEEEVARVGEVDDSPNNENRDAVHTDDREREAEPAQAPDVDEEIRNSERYRGIAADKANERAVPQVLIDREDHVPEESDREQQDAEDQEVEAVLKKAQERSDEHEAEKKARMRKAPLPPNERDW